MLKFITSVHTVNNRYLIIWGCFTAVTAHNRPCYALQCQFSEVLLLHLANEMAATIRFREPIVLVIRFTLCTLSPNVRHRL